MLFRSEVTGAHGITVRMDQSINEITSLSDALMLVLPGGMPGTKHLMESDSLKNLLVSARDLDIYIAAICAAPWILSHHGLIKGRKATCYPGFENEMTDFLHVDQSVVQDGTLITGKGAGVAMDFALKCVEVLKGHKVSEKLALALIHKIGRAHV